MIEEEIEALFAQITEARQAARTKFDRYRDFRAVFLDTPEGKRVLYDIMDMGHIYRSPFASDHHHTDRKLGEHNLALKIMMTTHVEPKKAPDKQNRKEDEDNG